ncbi:MAG: ribosome maturation factor RimM, partial [Bryobacteraceae bacterium]
LGVVSDLLETGATPLLEVRREGQQEPVLVPLARSICVKIEPEQGRIVVELPEGLEDLNRP